MIFPDSLMMAALAIFIVAWWTPHLVARGVSLYVLTSLALAAGLAGLYVDRWQDALGAAVAFIFLISLFVTRSTRLMKSRKWRIALGSSACLLVAGAAIMIWMFPLSPLPRPSGPYPVGVRTFELSDKSRRGLLGAAPGAPRRLLVRVWYPAASVTSLTEARPYFTKIEAQTLARAMGMTVGFPPLLIHLRHVKTNSYEDAPLREQPERFPVIFYSHGYTLYLSQNTVLMEDLASHGYVVFAVQHSYDSAPTPFADGSVAPLDPGLAADAAHPQSAADREATSGHTIDARLLGALDAGSEAVRHQDRIAFRSPLTWVADRIFVHDQLQRAEVPPAIVSIAAASDLDHVGEMGMSFGGATAAAVCMVDKRCVAAANLDGRDAANLALDRQIPVPLLMLHSDMRAFTAKVDGVSSRNLRSFNELSYEPFATAGQRTDIVRVSMLGARHLGLSDLPLFVRWPLRNRLFGSAPTDALLGIQTSFVRGFFDRYLRHQENGFPKSQLSQWRNRVEAIDVSDVRRWWRSKPASERTSLEWRIALEQQKRGWQIQ